MPVNDEFETDGILSDDINAEIVLRRLWARRTKFLADVAPSMRGKKAGADGSCSFPERGLEHRPPVGVTRQIMENPNPSWCQSPKFKKRELYLSSRAPTMVRE